MSNNNKKSTTTKLKGTEMLARHSRYVPQSHSNLHNDLPTSGSSHFDLQKQGTDWNNLKPKPILEQQQSKCGSRGMAIARLAQSISKTTNEPVKNSKTIYSNTDIEHYFNNLKEENSKKHKEENEKKWGNLIQTKKKS